MVRKIGIALLIIFVVAYGGICWFFSTLVITPNRKANTAFSEEFIASYGQPLDFEVEAFDSISLAGWYFDNPADGDCGVVIAHGWGSNRSGMLKFFPLAWTRGCDIAMYDQRGMGESGGKYGGGGLLEKEDFQVVNKWFQEKTGLGPQKVAYLGESWGAATVLHAAGGNSDIPFVLADSPFDAWNSAVTERAYRDYGQWIDFLMPGVTTFVKWRTGVDFYEANTKDATSKVTAPVFLIHSQADQATASSQSVNIAESLNDQSVFHHTDWGSDHVKDVSNYPHRYEKLFDEFISKNAPDWGKKIDIAYISNRNGFDIFKNDHLGEDEKQLTNNSGWDWSPAWNQSLNGIIYNSNDPQGKFQLRLMDINGIQIDYDFQGQEQFILNHQGNAFVYAVQNGEYSQVYVKNLTSSEIRPVTDNQSYNGRMKWSSDGVFLAYISNREGSNDIYTYNTRSDQTQRITEDSRREKYISWSPDSNHLAYTVQEEENTNSIFIYSFQEKTSKRVVDNTYNNVEINWSPDGSRLAYHSTRAGEDHIFVYYLYEGWERQISGEKAYHGEPEWIGY